jgi:NADP-dependent aldehyde dehydrogenase
MKIRSEQFIGHQYSKKGNSIFHALNAQTGETLGAKYYEATLEETDQAIALAEKAFDTYRNISLKDRSNFLQKIADEIEKIGKDLTLCAMQETGLPQARLEGERGRTCNQLRLFAKTVAEGSYVDARIDTAQPNRKPLPKPDIRMMNIALGPVAIFGSSNFPLAFSVAGGDTASALAAGCPVIVKAHPAHPGTSALVAEAIRNAVKLCGMAEGTFSMLQEKSRFSVAQRLVTHPAIKAIGFTGSYAAGKAIFDLANSRPEPIPVYAEMGSVNPVFILPEILESDYSSLAQGLVQSVTMGVGQFCTNPGLIITQKSETSEKFAQSTSNAISTVEAGVMLHQKILTSYRKGVGNLIDSIGVATMGMGIEEEQRAKACFLRVDGETFFSNPNLEEEVFGPSSILVETNSSDQLLDIAKKLRGHLTATIWGSVKELKQNRKLIGILEKKVGRLIFNGFPTGVEVCDAMVHGGPFPSTTDSRSTSVGTGAIKRFIRPVAYQDYPQDVLPDALKDINPNGIFRLVNGTLSQKSL